jgi:hypothetical protein
MATAEGFLMQSVPEARVRGGAPGLTVSIPSPNIPMEYGERILGLRRRRGWAGEGSRAIPLAACRAALRFVRLVRFVWPNLPLPRVAPSVRGAVSLYWRNGDEHLVVAVSSGDLDRLAIHWEGQGRRPGDEEGDYRRALAHLVSLFHVRS